MKTAIIPVVIGVLMILGVMLLPDETDIALAAGNQIIDSLDQSANNPTVSQVAADAKETFAILFIGVAIAGVLSAVIACITLLKRYDMV